VFGAVGVMRRGWTCLDRRGHQTLCRDRTARPPLVTQRDEDSGFLGGSWSGRMA